MPTRRNIYNILEDGGSTIASYRRGVEVMKARSRANSNDPTGWIFQANIHGTSENNPTFNQFWNVCQHRSFFFLSWHRMYIYFFERIVRSASGDLNFALPYWNYSQPNQRVLPQPFRIPADSSNTLYVSQRRTQINQGTPLPATSVDYSRALSYVNFFTNTGSFAPSFGGGVVSRPMQFASPNVTGQLENQPHNVIHGDIGGPGGWMSDPRLAARDPIFWLHHCNIDRLWEQWLRLGQGRSNPVNNSTWMDVKFSFFDENGQKQEMSGKDILDTASQLNYVYDDMLTPPPPTPPTVSLIAPASASPQLVGSTSKGEVIRLTTSAASFSISPVAQTAFSTALPVANQRVLLAFEGIEYDNSPGVNYEVYLLPNGQSAPKEENYVGTIGLFAMESHAHSHTGEHSGHEHGNHDTGENHSQATVVLEATQVVEALRQRGEWSGQFRISLVTTYQDQPVSEVRFKQISVYTL